MEHSKPVKQTYRDNRQWFQYTCRVEKRFLDTKWVLSALKTKVRGASFFMAIKKKKKVCTHSISGGRSITHFDKNNFEKSV